MKFIQNKSKLKEKCARSDGSGQLDRILNHLGAGLQGVYVGIILITLIELERPTHSFLMEGC